jgi:transglutaminase-like putative cysteine protease
MKNLVLLACVALALLGPLALAGQPATSPPAAQPTGERPLPELYPEALRLEETRELTRAEAIYRELVRRADGDQQWQLRRDAQQGLRRVADLRTEFSLSEADLHERLTKTYRGYQPQELAGFERRGWILARDIDGRRDYSSLNPTNLGFFDTQLMGRNESAAKSFRQFAQLFLDESAKLDRLRATAPVLQQHVAPVRMVFSTKAVVRQADLPPGRLVRAWFPYPLLTPAIQNIRLVSVQPAGALKSSPDVEADIGIAYLEVPRPEKDDLAIELKVAFDAYHTDCRIDPEAIPPYDTASELYRRFTRSEQQLALTPPLRELANSVVGGETNPYRKARQLYDWVCDNVKYNYVWRWRDATFTFGCASEEVRQRRIGDCVIQSVFYAALCRSVGLPARVHNGPIFPPGLKNDHVWAEVYFPQYGWLPVDVTYSEVASMVPGLTDIERRQIRDFFFGRLDRWRLCTQRNTLAQELVPVKRSPRRHVTMFVRPELECGGQDVEQRTLTWDCQPEKGEDSCGK